MTEQTIFDLVRPIWKPVTALAGSNITAHCLLHETKCNQSEHF